MSPEAVLSVLMVGQRAGRSLNRLHRGIDQPTDVLSFAQYDPDEEWPVEPDPWLGDIVICVPIAAAQARALGHSLVDELAVLLTHGLLHLLGMDHAQAQAARHMAESEMSVLAAVGCDPERALAGRVLW